MNIQKVVFFGPLARKVDAPRAFLARAGFKVIVGETGPQLLELAGRERPALCVLALNMPERLGDAVMADLRCTLEAAAPPVIMVCADSDAEARRCEAAGATAVVRSPWSKKLLLGAAGEILGIARRKAKRVLVGIDVRPTVVGRELLFGTLVNISLTGTLLQTTEELPLGTRLGLAFALPGHADRLECNATIVREETRVNDRFYGVQFERLVEADRAAIERFVETADPPAES